MGRPSRDPAEIVAALERVLDESRAYLAELADGPVRLATSNDAAARFDGSLPADGIGTEAAIRELLENGLDAHVRSGGPRFFLELLAPAPLNIVCFKYRPQGVSEDRLDDLNLRIGEAVLTDGRVYVGTTRFAGKVAFRPAFVNWRTQESDALLMLETVRDLGRQVARDQ